MKRIVVTGKNGQLASELQEVLKENKKVECHFLGRNEIPLEQVPIIQDILAMYQPDVIIHTAAYTAVDQAEEEQEKANIINHQATEQIAEYCTVHKARLIYISTDYVFDGSGDQPLNEDTEVNPINVYGKTKYLGEQAVWHFAPDAVIIRTSWVYSAFGNNFVKTMLKLMDERAELQVVADQFGLPTYAGDLAELITKIAKAEDWHSGVYHFTNTGEGISWYDFACAIRDLAQKNVNIKAVNSDEFVRKAKRPQYSVLDSVKIQNTFDWHIPNWRESLEKMLKRLES